MPFFVCALTPFPQQAILDLNLAPSGSIAGSVADERDRRLSGAPPNPALEGSSMKIAEVSKKYGVTADTLRYYERIGLLRPVPRTASGVRDYGEADCQRIEFVKCMRAAGMPIDALIEYMNLFEQDGDTAAQRKAILETQRDLLKQRIATMQEGLDRLDKKIETYDTLMLDAERRMRDAERTGRG